MRLLLFLFLPLSMFASINASELYFKCSKCHGLKANNNYMFIIKPLVDLSESQIIKSLKYYQQGDQKYGYGLVMKKEVDNLTDDEIKKLAEYIKSDEIIKNAEIQEKAKKLAFEMLEQERIQKEKEEIEQDLDKIIEKQKPKITKSNNTNKKKTTKVKELPKPTKEEIAIKKDKELKRKHLEKLGLGYLN